MRSTFRILLSVAALLASAAAVAAQADRLNVTSRKVKYSRTGRGLSEYKRSFEVNYPVLSGGPSAAARTKIVNAISYWRVFETTLAANRSGRETWLDSFDHEIVHNKDNIFAIRLIEEGSAAYPDGAVRNLVFDIRTGTRLTIADLFQPSEMQSLLVKVRARLQENEDAAIAETPETREILDQERESFPDIHRKPSEITFKDIKDFFVTDAGVTFVYEYGFAHVVQALEPSGHIELSFAELRPFIRQDGLLARYVR
jgi:hypothetical protein